jgi:hypothetical protein
MKVTIYHLKNGEDAVLGSIAWHGQALQFSAADPEDEATLRGLAEDVLTNDQEGNIIDALSQPGAWLSNLYRALSSAYLRAGQPTADTQPDPEPSDSE